MIQTQSQRIADRIRQEITSGAYRPGTALSLRRIASAMRTSIIPVRDALARLQQEGLVEGLPGRGCRVRDIGEEHLGDLAVLREALECQVARLCALRATRDQLEELALLGRQADRARQQAESEAAEERFHLRLAEVAGSRELLAAIRRARVIQLAFGPALSVTGRLRLHARLVAAIARRDPDVSEREMRRHLAVSEDHRVRQVGKHIRTSGNHRGSDTRATRALQRKRKDMS